MFTSALAPRSTTASVLVAPVASRTDERAQRLAAAFGSSAVRYEQQPGDADFATFGHKHPSRRPPS